MTLTAERETKQRECEALTAKNAQLQETMADYQDEMDDLEDQLKRAGLEKAPKNPGSPMHERRNTEQQQAHEEVRGAGLEPNSTV